MGLLSNIIIENMRAKRAEEAAARQAQSVQTLLGERATFREAGPGLAGPPERLPGRGLLGQVDQPSQQAFIEFAGGLLGSPETMQAGASIFSTVLQQYGQDRRQIGQLEATREIARADRQQRQEQFEDRLGETQFQNDRTYLLDYARTAARLHAEKMNSAAAAGNLSKNWGLYPHESGREAPAPHFSTPDWNAAAAEVNETGSALRNVQELKALVSEQGETVLGPTAAKMQVLYQQLLSDIGKRWDLGVFQQGDLDRVQKAAADPTALSSLYRRKATVLASLGALEQQIGSDHLLNQYQYGHYPGMQPLISRGFGLSAGGESSEQARQAARTRAALANRQAQPPADDLTQAAPNAGPTAATVAPAPALPVTEPVLQPDAGTAAATTFEGPTIRGGRQGTRAVEGAGPAEETLGAFIERSRNPTRRGRRGGRRRQSRRTSRPRQRKN